MRALHSLITFCLLSSLHAAIEYQPVHVFYQVDGKQVVVVVAGSEISSIKSVNALRNGSPSRDLFIRLGMIQGDRRALFIMAKEGLTPESEYLIQPVFHNGTRPAPLPLTIVPEGDPRATKEGLAKTVDEAKKRSKNQKKIVLDIKSAPAITATRPHPLELYSTGQTQTLYLKGTNLNKINNVRLRSAQKPPKYRNDQGTIPFRFEPKNQHIEVDLVASPDTESGKQYALDLFIDRYRATTIVVTVRPPRKNTGPTVIEIPRQP